MSRVEYYISTEEIILSLTPSSREWKDLAFYYPKDKDYFYQCINGEMRPIGKSASSSISTGEGIGLGVKINGKVMGGVKTAIAVSDEVEIPIHYDYNTFTLSVYGKIDNFGQINIMQ